MGPVWQNPIQRTVRTVNLSVLMTVHNFSTQYNIEQSLLLPPDKHHSSDAVYWRGGSEKAEKRAVLRPWRGCRMERESRCRSWVQTVCMRWLQWERCTQHSGSDGSAPQCQLTTNTCQSSTACSLHCVMTQPPCHSLALLSASSSSLSSSSLSSSSSSSLAAAAALASCLIYA